MIKTFGWEEIQISNNKTNCFRCNNKLKNNICDNYKAVNGVIYNCLVQSDDGVDFICGNHIITIINNIAGTFIDGKYISIKININITEEKLESLLVLL